MALSPLRTHLRQILLMALAAPAAGACGGAITVATGTLGEADAAAPSPAASSSSSSSGSASDSDASFDVDAGEATDAAVDASIEAADASDAASGACTVVAPGNPGGANCSPMILDCDPAVSGTLDCATVCVGHPESTCYATDGGARVYCYYGCGGRRPVGFDVGSSDALSSVGAFFANLAALEAASIDAFEILKGELAAHDAPAALVDAAMEAAEDEVRHARITAALARRHGAEPATAVAPKRHAVRDLEAIAIENAREGCVRETFGVLVAMHQAERAADPVIRRAMRRIAEDETRHAALARDVAAWAASKLDDEARSRVEAATEAALDDLRREAVLEPARDLRETAGMPSAAVAARMVEALRTLENQGASY